MTIHPLRCLCGSVRGELHESKMLNRGLCYCKDCQAFAYFLNRAAEVLDAQGGTDIVQTTPRSVRFTAGSELLACMRLSENGLLRWYARCCNTPIGNTPANFGVAFVGLIHTCLPTNGAADRGLDAIAPVRMHVHTQSARGAPKPKAGVSPLAVLRFGLMLLRARITGAYKQNPFFNTQGLPLATPRVLSAAERDVLFSRVAD